MLKTVGCIRNRNLASTTYYWDEVNDNLFGEEDESGDVVASYTHEPGLYGEIIAQQRGDDLRYYNYDGLGNTVELTDENENVTDTYEYSAFGEEIVKTGTTENPFGYQGALGYYTNSETKDIYVRARTYESKIGRWLSRDPIGFINWNRTKQGLNLFEFVGGNPMNNHDPSGLMELSDHFWSIVQPRFPSIPEILNGSKCGEQARDILRTLIKRWWDAKACAFWGYPLDSNMAHAHCLWNCRMAYHKDEEFAEKCSLDKENYDKELCDKADLMSDDCFDKLPGPLRRKIAGTCCSAFQESDFRDNAIGRECASAVKNACPERPLNCRDCCTLYGVPPDAEEGGTERPYSDRCVDRYMEIMMEGRTPPLKFAVNHVLILERRHYATSHCYRCSCMLLLR